MSQNNLPVVMPNVERLLQRIASAEKSNQKEVRITIQEARDLTIDLALLTSKLGQSITDINKSLSDLRDSIGKIDVKFDGGGFE